MGQGKYVVWTEDLLAMLADHDVPTREIAEILGVHQSTVSNARKKLDQGEIPNSNRNVGCKLDTCERKHKAHGYCALHLNRVRVYGNPLEGMTYQDISRWATDPLSVGTRTLVAKTCISCNLFYPSSMFNKTKSGWSQRCRKCESARKTERQTNKSPSKAKHFKQFQDRVMALTSNGERRGFEITNRDIEICSDPKITKLEKAIRTGRTYGGVSAICQKNGFKSRRLNSIPSDEDLKQWQLNFRRSSFADGSSEGE